MVAEAWRAVVEGVVSGMMDVILEVVAGIVKVKVQLGWCRTDALMPNGRCGLSISSC